MMKKLIYSLVALSLVFSCENQDDHGVDVNNYNGDNPVVYFTSGAAASYFVTPTADAFKIQ